MFFTPLRQSIGKHLNNAVRILNHTPPRFVSYAFYWFRVGLGIFLLLSLILSLTGCASLWQSTNDSIPQPLLERAITENTQLPVEEAKKSLTARRIAGRDGSLLLFFYNHPGTCGRLGCLFTAYWQHGDTVQRVLSGYFDNNQPAGSQTIQVVEPQTDANSALPCLQINQPLQKNEQLRKLTYCLSLSGEKYRVVSGGIVDQSKSVPQPRSKQKR